MNNRNIIFTHVVTNSFVVNEEKLNDRSVLSLCSMLAAVTNMTDDVIIALFGTLDFEQIIMRHFDLGITGDASLNDIVTLYSYINVYEEDRVVVKMVAKKQDGDKKIAIANGNFLFAIKNGVAMQFSMS